LVDTIRYDRDLPYRAQIVPYINIFKNVHQQIMNLILVSSLYMKIRERLSLLSEKKKLFVLGLSIHRILIPVGNVLGLEHLSMEEAVK